MKVKLVKLSDNVNNLRTQEVVGDAESFPVEGQSFVMYSEPLTEGMDVRMIQTSPVTSVLAEDPDYVVFYTENSTYGLTILEDGE